MQRRRHCLRHDHGDPKILPPRPPVVHCRFRQVAEEVAAADMAFFTTDQLALFPTRSVDVFASVSVIHELTPDQIEALMMLQFRATYDQGMVRHARSRAGLYSVACDPRIDPDRLAPRLVEPAIGNPIPIHLDGRMISQDVANSLRELRRFQRYLAGTRRATFADLGAGYGRLGYVAIIASGCRYWVVDIPPALAVAEWYLSRCQPAVCRPVAVVDRSSRRRNRLSCTFCAGSIHGIVVYEAPSI
jgi:hypothetical protein